MILAKVKINIYKIHIIMKRMLVMSFSIVSNFIDKLLIYFLYYIYFF